ncbi:MAG: SSU ribosomal protein S7p (S5e), partial [uncultured Gemmatimonadetes bacterium]
ESPQPRCKAPDHSGSRLRERVGHQVRQHPHARRQEVDGRGDLLRRDEDRRGALRSAGGDDLQGRAEQRQAGARGEEPPGGRRHLPGAGGSPPGAPHRSRHALAGGLCPRPRREDDGRPARRRASCRVAQRGRYDQEEGRHAPHGGRQQGLRALPLV